MVYFDFVKGIVSFFVFLGIEDSVECELMIFNVNVSFLN